MDTAVVMPWVLCPPKKRGGGEERASSGISGSTGASIGPVDHLEMGFAHSGNAEDWFLLIKEKDETVRRGKIEVVPQSACML